MPKFCGMCGLPLDSDTGKCFSCEPLVICEQKKIVSGSQLDHLVEKLETIKNDKGETVRNDKERIEQFKKIRKKESEMRGQKTNIFPVISVIVVILIVSFCGECALSLFGHIYISGL